VEFKGGIKNMQVEIPGTENFATVPVKNSELYNIIINCQSGRWQKNKCIDILTHGYTLNDRGEKSKKSEKVYDYSVSLKNLIGRINEALEPTGLYSIEIINNYYYIAKKV
jgi:hypothetical protein